MSEQKTNKYNCIIHIISLIEQLCVFDALKIKKNLCIFENSKMKDFNFLTFLRLYHLILSDNRLFGYQLDWNYRINNHYLIKLIKIRIIDDIEALIAIDQKLSIQLKNFNLEYDRDQISMNLTQYLENLPAYEGIWNEILISTTREIEAFYIDLLLITSK